MHITVYYSSITGNTKKLAVYMAQRLRLSEYQVELTESSLALKEGYIEEGQTDIIILAFWCRRSGLDEVSAELLSRRRGRRIIGIGTIGGDAGGTYGDRVRRNVREAIEKENICLGVEICQGAINLKRVERRRYLPKESKHYVSPDKYERFLRTQGHPNQEDIESIAAFVEKILSH